MLATTVHDNPTDWESHLKKVCMAYESPFLYRILTVLPDVWTAGQATVLLDIVHVYGSAPTEAELHHQYARKLNQSLEQAYSTAREHVGTAVERAIETYNGKVHGDSFEAGDLVWLNNPVVPRGVPRKLHCPWSGPFKVVKRISSAVYRIQDQRTSRSHQIVVHFDRLKRCPLDMQAETAPPSGSTPRPLVGQQTGPERALPPGTNLQYFEDEEPEETEMDRLCACDQRTEQNPPDQEVTVTSLETEIMVKKWKSRRRTMIVTLPSKVKRRHQPMSSLHGTLSGFDVPRLLWFTLPLLVKPFFSKRGKVLAHDGLCCVI